MRLMSKFTRLNGNVYVARILLDVFETMAQQGTGNPRLMAAGISQATIPTMAGMIAALSGVFFSSRLDAKVKLAKAKLVDSLPHH